MCMHTSCAEQCLCLDDSNWICPWHLLNSLKSLVVRTNRDWDTKYSAFAMQRPEYLVWFVADAAGNMMKLDFLFVNIFRVGSHMVHILRYKISRRSTACLSSLVPVSQLANWNFVPFDRQVIVADVRYDVLNSNKSQKSLVISLHLRWYSTIEASKWILMANDSS